MKKIIMAAAVFGAFATATIGTSVPAVADAFSFSFNTGDVAFAYNDGYWDRDHRWHKWRNAREAREYRNRFSHNYYNHRHDKDRRTMGWRDNDHDGVPNRFDDRPNNPYRN